MESFEDTFKKSLSDLGGYWEYKSGRYLAQLASGKLSDVFCNTGLLTTNPRECAYWVEVLARVVRAKLNNRGMDSLSVVGPGMGGITLAYELAGALARAFANLRVHAFYTEPFEMFSEITKTPVKLQKFRFELPKGTSVLLVEDVVTTGGSVQKTYDAIAPQVEDLIAIVPCLVDRRLVGGPLEPIEIGPVKAELVPILRIHASTWDTLEDAKKVLPNVTEALRPKANWEKLVRG